MSSPSRRTGSTSPPGTGSPSAADPGLGSPAPSRAAPGDSVDELVAALGARPKPFMPRTGASGATDPVTPRKQEPTVMIAPPSMGVRLAKWTAAGLVISAGMMGGAVLLRERQAGWLGAPAAEPAPAANVAPSAVAPPPEAPMLDVRAELPKPPETIPVEALAPVPTPVVNPAPGPARTRRTNRSAPVAAPVEREPAEAAAPSTHATPAPTASTPKVDVPGLDDLKTHL